MQNNSKQGVHGIRVDTVQFQTVKIKRQIIIQKAGNLGIGFIRLGVFADHGCRIHQPAVPADLLSRTLFLDDILPESIK